ncbi:unnamed protein product [Phytophthora fragariaefolia]|uniref:Unnamed protein product n=1 Tax=Phytophthora fragariaefolia TaxID=1490495 RepID=A0A9W6XGH1_9STRA|nr:unnamed protein product [Phytophthora fragariaefolia]
MMSYLFIDPAVISAQKQESKLHHPLENAAHAPLDYNKLLKEIDAYHSNFDVDFTKVTDVIWETLTGGGYPSAATIHDVENSIPTFKKENTLVE